MQKKGCFRIIVLYLLLFTVNAAINPHGPAVVDDFTGCINNLIEKNFDKPGLLIFGSTNHGTSLILNIRAKILRRIHESIHFSVEIATANDEVGICNGNVEDDFIVLHRDHFQAVPVADYYVIIIDNFQDFIHIASKLIRFRSWNPQAKFFIAFINFIFDEYTHMQFVEDMLSCLFRYNAINVLVLIPQTGQLRNALLYSWRPYEPPKYCGYFNETAKNRLVLENACERGVIKHDTLMFYDKVPTNMRECTVYVLAIERQPFFSSNDDGPNIEKFLVNKLLENFNLTVKYKFVNEFRGERNKSRMWNGALSKLVAKEGQILLGGIFPDYDVHEDFECSSSYLADSYTWVVPRADPFPPRMALTIIFNTLAWFSIAAVFLLCVLTWKVLGVMSNDSKYNKSFYHCFLNTFCITLGGAAYVRPVKRSLQIFFVFLNLYCTLLITAYETKLIQVLQNPIYENQVDTIEELVESGLKFGGTEELRDLFSNSNDTFDNVIHDKWIVVDYISDALIDVAKHRNFSVLCSRLELAYLSAVMPELRDCFGKLRYYTFDWNTFSVPAEMVALRGFPFMSKFSATLNSFKRLGINVKARRRFAAFNSIERARLLLSLNVKTSQFQPLSIRHLQGGYHILIIGAVGGSVVLLIEIIVNCKYTKYFIFKSK